MYVIHRNPSMNGAHVRKLNVTCICRYAYTRVYACLRVQEYTRTPLSHLYAQTLLHPDVRAYTRTHVPMKSLVHALTHTHVYKSLMSVHSCTSTRVHLKSVVYVYMRARVHTDTYAQVQSRPLGDRNSRAKNRACTKGSTRQTTPG